MGVQYLMLLPARLRALPFLKLSGTGSGFTFNRTITPHSLTSYNIEGEYKGSTIDSCLWSHSSKGAQGDYKGCTIPSDAVSHTSRRIKRAYNTLLWMVSCVALRGAQYLDRTT